MCFFVCLFVFLVTGDHKANYLKHLLFNEAKIWVIFLQSLLFTLYEWSHVLGCQPDDLSDLLKNLGFPESHCLTYPTVRQTTWPWNSLMSQVFRDCDSDSVPVKGVWGFLWWQNSSISLHLKAQGYRNHCHFS